MRRYFAIRSGKQIVSMTDEAALGRVLSDLLRQYLVGKAQFVVFEVSKKDFEAYKNRPGSVRT